MVQHHAKTKFIPLRIAVMTVSDSRTEENDTSGKTLVDKLTAAGHQLAEKRIVPDDIYDMRAVVSGWIADPEVSVVISTGGTGLTGRDSTPEALRPLLDREIPGIAEVFGPMIIAEVGEISRFLKKKEFVAYCGLAPTVRQSANNTYRGSLRPDCNHWLRYAFVEAAHSCKKVPGPYRDYYLDKAEKRDKKIATVATARRLCRLVFAMLWSGEDYRAEPGQAA